MSDARFTYSVYDLNLSAEHLSGVMGYLKETTPDLILDLTQKGLETSAEISSIKAEYRLYDDFEINLAEGSISIAGTRFNTRKIIVSQLRGSSSAAIFTGTAGPEIGELSKKYMSDGDLLEGYILDVIGSELVEAAVDRMQKELALEAEKTGTYITNRFSPGYCGWDVAEQHLLFSLIPDNFCDITLTDSALMTPVKSVSGIIGVGKSARYQPYTCNRCDSENCIYRGRR